MSITSESLERRIEKAVEQVVREYLSECEALATSAVTRAFEKASARPSPKPQAGAAKKQKRATPRSWRDIEAQAEKLHAVICAHPGETMSVLAPAAGATAPQLRLAAARLRSAGRVRSIGERGSTRYFPMG